MAFVRHVQVDEQLSGCGRTGAWSAHSLPARIGDPAGRGVTREGELFVRQVTRGGESRRGPSRKSMRLAQLVIGFGVVGSLIVGTPAMSSARTATAAESE